LDAEAIEQRGQHLEDFSIDGRRLASCGAWPDDLRPDLVELAIAAFLRPLPAELRANVIEALQARAFPKLVLDVGANHARGVLRPQAQPLAFFALRAGAILPGEHLLADDVSLFPHGPLKELQVFQDGRADLLKVVYAKDAAYHRFDEIPCLRVRRKQVARA